jgi:tRNA pseudouridine32 synthase/23S rRNA pseudouridine746 synthase
LKILFDNPSFVAVDKAPETLSVPSRTGESDTRPVVGLILQKQLGIQIYPVHRLDFEVSGVLLFAKTPEAHRFANAGFENHHFEKTYQAITTVSDQPAQKEFRWVDKLFRGKKRAFVADHGKEAITLAKKIGSFSKNSNWEVWELKPITGRSHQLRVHMSLYQSSIVGDALYGSREIWGEPGIALRAVELRIPANGSEFGLPAKITCDGFS